MRIDLHTHSDASDGTDSPARLVANARVAKLDVVALTDHDTVAGHPAAVAAVRDDPGTREIALVRGAEFSCLLNGVSLHLLGYLFDPAHAELAREMALLRTDRTRRAQAMVAKLVELGAPIDWERVSRIAGGAAVGRPHVARALVEVGLVPDVAAAFSDEWIGDGGRAYVEKYSLAPQRAIELVKAAGGVTVFAHPGAAKRGEIVDESAIEAFAAAGLDGIEIDHPDHDHATRVRLRDLASGLRLLVTGSSDYHGFVKSTPIGAETTDPAVFEELISRATGAQVVRG
ncbi:MAG TPA: PHP domain-containing protein [Acidothermaceae bacterium]